MQFGGFNFSRIKGFVFFATLFFFISATSILHNIIDYDLFSRLIMGEYVYYNHRPMFQDIVSYTNTHTWFDPEWLSSLLIYVINEKFGVVGLTFLKSIGHFLILLSIAFAIHERNKTLDIYKMGFYLVLLLILIQCSFITFTVRCQILTFILMAIWILMLEKIRKGNNIYLYFLPFLMLLWLNSHGGCIAGVGILFLYGIGEFLNGKDYKKYFISLFFVSLVFLINPWGIDYIKFLFDSAFLDRAWISEWNSPFNYAKMCLMYQFFMFFSFASLIYKIYDKKLTFKTINKTKFLIVLVVAFLSAKYIKHIGLMIVIFSIFLYEDYFAFYNYLMEKARKYFALDKIVVNNLVQLKNILIYVFMYAFSLAIFLIIPINISHMKHTLTHFPVSAVQFLNMNNIEGKIFTPFYFGGFCAYKLYPNNTIYMDGRQEQVYDIDIFDNQMFFLGVLGKNHEKVLKEGNPDIILVENVWRVVPKLDKNSDYKKIYQDSYFSIYLKNEKVRFDYVSPILDEKYLIKTLFYKNYRFGKDKI